jgi:hypothetical protein
MNTEKSMRERQQFLNAMHAQDIAKLARDTVVIDGEYDSMQHRINTKNKITLWVLFFSSCLLLALTVML